MATSILMLIIILLAITAFPWLHFADTGRTHATDLMAGDEGDD